uniref:Uncharacterized protein n=1 Tax=Zygnema circumcarinatum TaxID=35869 RepID=Q32RJ2_ZYGCR|nr:hypothetical protein P8547_pgp036 [Zygnema circumcarinatum]AAX45887.1 hypothetical protein [Zygnema circumcarinatum]
MNLVSQKYCTTDFEVPQKHNVIFEIKFKHNVKFYSAPYFLSLNFTHLGLNQNPNQYQHMILYFYLGIYVL